MKRFLWKLALFLFPLLLVIGGNLLLPLNFFTFRVWEALIVCRRNSILAGPFYPRQMLVMVEEGDLAHATPGAEKRRVVWQTDAHGYRKANHEAAQPASIVIFGDSNVVGTSLTQDDILSEVLERKIRQVVYPLAPGTVNDFLRDERFFRYPPKVAVFVQMERDIANYQPIAPATIHHTWHTNPTLQGIAVTVDRIFKKEIQQYVMARLRPHHPLHRFANIFFFSGDPANHDVSVQVIDEAVETLSSYRNYFSSRGILFVYLPVPNKETIYWDFLPSKHSNTFLRQVIDRAKISGIPTIDLLAAYEAARAQGIVPYQRDDSHWNKTGVEIASDLLDRLIAQGKLSN